MSIIPGLKEKLTKSYTPTHLEIINESSGHNVPAGSESHFKIVLVSERFIDRKLLERQREVYQVLEHELKNSIHALSLVLKTPQEWSNQKNIPSSPPCLGGSKNDPEF